MIIVSFCDLEVGYDGFKFIIPRTADKKFCKSEKLVGSMVERYNDLTERIRFKNELINDKQKAERCVKTFDSYSKICGLTKEEQYCYNFVKYWSKRYK